MMTSAEISEVSELRERVSRLERQLAVVTGFIIHDMTDHSGMHTGAKLAALRDWEKDYHFRHGESALIGLGAAKESQ